MKLNISPRRAACCGAFGILALGALISGGTRTITKAAAPPDGPPAVTPTTMDPVHVMGAQACIECHKPIVAAWQTTKHATGFDKLRENPNAKNYAKEMGIAAADITKAVCANCHGMRAAGTANRTTTGVSCESCHGPAGGDSGWLNLHGSYGAKGVTRDMETADHLKMRFEMSDKAGMVRPERVYLLARNCYACHLMSGHQDVVDKGGHHAGSAEFELVSWLHGEVSHNLFIDPTKNADAPSLWMTRSGKTSKERNRVLYIVGKLAGLEVSLRNVAEATKEDSFAHAMAGHARDYHDDLADIGDAAKLDDLSNIADEISKMRRKLKPDNKEELLKLADRVSKTALDLVKNHDGSKLSGVDSLIPKNMKGDRYQPK
jgi:Cytochrome c554 and c-prime